MKKFLIVLAVLILGALPAFPAFAISLVTDAINVDLGTSFDYMVGFWNVAAPVVWPLMGIGLVVVLFGLFQKARSMAGG